MAVVTRKERNARRNDALAKIEKGWGVGQTINYLVHDYKITRRSANLDVQWASAKLVQNLNKTERTDLLAWLLYQSQQVFLKILFLYCPKKRGFYPSNFRSTVNQF